MSKISIRNKYNEEKEYYCDYEIENNRMIITIYDLYIYEFIESKDGNGMITDIDFRDSSFDALLVDCINSKVFYLQNMKAIFNIKPGATYIKFYTYEMFEGKMKQQNIMREFFDKKGIKIEEIKCYSSNLLKYLYEGIKLDKDFKKIEIIENKKNEKNINVNNIEKIIIGKDINEKLNKEGFFLKFISYIKIIFIEKITFENIHNYLKELVLYLKLYGIANFKIDYLHLKINGTYIKCYYNFLINSKQNIIEYENSEFRLDEFIQNCYQKFHDENEYYNKYFNDIFIMFNHSYLYQEDIFLMYYRFVEFYYKTENNNKPRQVEFIKELLDTCLEDDEKKTRYEAIGIVSLRNHYVHNGYYIRNNKIEKAETKSKTIKTSPTFINKKTELLKEVVINIILKKILN